MPTIDDPEQRRKILDEGIGPTWEGLARMAGARMVAGHPLDRFDEEALRRFPDEVRRARMAIRINNGEIDPEQV